MLNDARAPLEIRVVTGSVWKSRLLIMLVAVLFMTTIASYFVGKYRADIDWEEAVDELDAIEGNISSLRVENEKLKNEVEFEKAKSQGDLQIKHHAYNEIARTLAETSREIAGLRENIRFYESIIEGDENKKGLQIKKMYLQSDGTISNYRFRVIIVNTDISKKLSKGAISLEIEGTTEDELRTIKVATGAAGKNTKFKFKYFHRIDGSITIPEGFLPKRLHLTAKLSGNKSEKEEKWYNWDILLNKNLPNDENLTGT